jgi:hypothetical protein
VFNCFNIFPFVDDAEISFLAKMGVYLSTPKTDKLSEDGENDKLKFGLSSMQGWRASMEDAVSFPLQSYTHCFMSLNTIEHRGPNVHLCVLKEEF